MPTGNVGQSFRSVTMDLRSTNSDEKPVTPAVEVAGSFAQSFEGAAGLPPGVVGVERVERIDHKRFGFTLIEMMIVMSIIVILLGLAVPYYQKGILRAKETVLSNNLTAIRNAIDEYSYDKQKAPQNLQDLVTNGYLREVPKDTITGSNDTWKITMEDAGQAVNANEPGIYDVHSGSPLKGLDNRAYSDW